MEPDKIRGFLPLCAMYSHIWNSFYNFQTFAEIPNFHPNCLDQQNIQNPASLKILDVGTRKSTYEHWTRQFLKSRLKDSVCSFSIYLCPQVRASENEAPDPRLLNDAGLTDHPQPWNKLVKL